MKYIPFYRVEQSSGLYQEMGNGFITLLIFFNYFGLFALLMNSYNDEKIILLLMDIFKSNQIKSKHILTRIIGIVKVSFVCVMVEDIFESSCIFSLNLSYNLFQLCSYKRVRWKPFTRQYFSPMCPHTGTVGPTTVPVWGRPCVGRPCVGHLANGDSG